MVQVETFEEHDYEIKPEKNHAQILIEINSSKKLEQVKEIIENLGIHVVQTKYLAHNWLLIKLDVMDMREIVLKLSESGFTNMKGINALSF